MVVQQKIKFSNCDSTVDQNVLKEQTMFVFGSQFLIQLSGAADVTPSVLQCDQNVAEQPVLFQMAKLHQESERLHPDANTSTRLAAAHPHRFQFDTMKNSEKPLS